MEKEKDILLFLKSLGIEFDEYRSARIKNRNARFYNGYLEIGECDKTFDRWSNSGEFGFELYHKKEQRRFRRWNQYFNIEGHVLHCFDYYDKYKFFYRNKTRDRRVRTRRVRARRVRTRRYWAK
ncbi:MAG: hypothetical protein QM504_07985 [Pseudomonadota bacterium]